MNLNVAHIIIKIREQVKYYFADFVLHKNINIMFIVKSSWSYLNKKILPHLCECLDNASFDFRGIDVNFVDSLRQPHFLFIFVTFFIQPQGQNLLLCHSCCVYETQIVEAPPWICRNSAIYYVLMISDSLILDLRNILHFIPPKPQCNVFSQFKPDIKMTPCKTIFQLMTRRYKCTNTISGGCRQRKMQDQRLGRGLMMKCGAILWYNIHVGGGRA